MTMHKRPSIAFFLLLGLATIPSAARGNPFAGAYSSALATDSAHGWGAGMEATFLAPHGLNSGPITFENVSHEFGLAALAELERLEGAPRVWLGRRGELWGVRGRFWLYDADAAGAFSDIGSVETFALASAVQGLSAKTADLEVTRCFGLGRWNGDAFLGARWAELERNAMMNADVMGDGVADAAQQAAQSIASGVGLTFGVDSRRPIGDWGLAMVLNARGSILWGDRAQNLYQCYADSGMVLLENARVDERGAMWIAEIQAGMEWTSALRAINAEVFSQVLFECQFWNSVDPTDVDLEQEFGTTRLNTSSLRSDVDFIGLTWSMGFRR